MAHKKNIFGYHSVVSALSTMPQSVKILFLQPKERDKRFLQLVNLATENHIEIRYITKSRLDEIMPLGNHQGVIAEVSYLGEYTESYLEVVLNRYDTKIFLLILDGVQDPHNLGACLRTANAAGVNAIIIPKDRACGLTPTVCKTASGAIGVTPIIRVANLTRTIEILKNRNIWVYGVTEEAKQNIYDCQKLLSLPLALVFGSEGEGLRKLTKESCDEIFSIPMKGTVQNLNVSVAVGISLFAVVQKLT